MGCSASTSIQTRPRYPIQSARVLVPAGQQQVTVVPQTTLQAGYVVQAQNRTRYIGVNVPQTTVITQQYPPSLAPLPAQQPPQQAQPQRPAVDIKEVVKKFQLLNPLILDLERKNLVTRVEEKIRQRDNIERDCQELKGHLSELEARTKKELQDVTNLREMANSSSISNFFSSQLQYDQQFSKEEEEYIQAKTEQENCYKRLLSLQEESSRISSDIEQLKRERNELLNLYDEVDNILVQVFGGVYGSTLEDQLEGKTDQSQDKLRRIETAMRAWKSSEAMTRASVGQLEFACKRWWDVQRIPKTGSYQMLRIQAISETRNHLIAAAQNLAHTQRNVNPVKLPYCDSRELSTLSQAINFIYIDGMSRERHAHAYHVFRTTHARAIMLARWIENVISKKIAVDLVACRGQYVENRQALRKERLRLMKEKVKEQTGQDLDIDETKAMDVGAEIADSEAVSTVAVAEAEKVEDAQDLNEKIEKAKAENEEEEEETKEDEEKPSLDELAPPPSKNELFGDLDTIMAEYGEQQKALQHEQDIAKARQEANFREKLRRRRSRKMRLEAQGIQIEGDNGPPDAPQK